MATYQITIKLPAESSQNTVVAGQQGTDSSPSQSGNKTEQGALKAAKGLVSFSAAAAFADNLISYEISQVELQTGAREYEQKLQFAYSTTKKVIGIASATAIGAKTGGPIGAIAGFIGSTFYTMLGYAQNARTIQTKQNLEDISLGMASIRAGISGRRSPNQ